MSSDQKRKFAPAKTTVFGPFSQAFRPMQRPGPRALCFAVTLLLALFPADAHARSAATASAEVTALVQRFVQAQKSYDPATIRELTAENYVEVSPLGEVDARKAVLGFYDPSQRVDVPSASVSDLEIRILGKTAIVIAAVRYVVAIPGQPSHEVAMRATYVAMRSEKAWKLVSAQYSAIHPHGPAH